MERKRIGKEDIYILYIYYTSMNKNKLVFMKDVVEKSCYDFI